MQRGSLTTGSPRTLMAPLTVSIFDFLVFRKEVRRRRERKRKRQTWKGDCGRQREKSFRDFVGNVDSVDDRGSAGEGASTPLCHLERELLSSLSPGQSHRKTCGQNGRCSVER